MYYRENVEGLRLLLERCAAAGVEDFLFPSGRAVYGNPAMFPDRRGRIVRARQP